MKAFKAKIFTEVEIEKIRVGLKLFLDQEFYACHDHFEDLWRENKGQKIEYFYWSLTHMAVSYFHRSNFNKIGTKDQLKRSLEKWKIFIKN